MAWIVAFDAAALKELARLDKPVAKRITAFFLREGVAPVEAPRAIDEALNGSRLGEFWKYRVGNYRIIWFIEDGRLTILVVRFGSRREFRR